MEISSVLSSAHRYLWQKKSDAGGEYWRIKQSLPYRLASDFTNNRQLASTRATLVAGSLSSRLDDALGEGPSRLTERRYTKGKTFTERSQNKFAYWRQVVGGGVNLGLKIFLLGAAHTLSFATCGYIFSGYEPYCGPSEPVVPRDLDRKMARIEARLAPVMNPLLRGLGATLNYFAGADV